MTSAEIAIIVNQAAAKYGVSPEALMAIANLESSGNVSAKNPRSSASGLFQFVNETANEYGLTGSRRNDPMAQADAAAKMMATNQRALTRTLGREPNAGELYLAHQQGLGGASALLRNPNRPAVDVLTDVYGSRQKAVNAVRLNGGDMGQSAGQFSGQWVNKANQRAALIPPADIPNVVASRTDVTRPTVPATRSSTPTNAASRAAPAFPVTPQLAPGNTDIYSYHIPDITPASLVGGAGSLTPTIGQRDPIQMPRPRPVNDRDIANVPYNQGQNIPVTPSTPRQLPGLPPAPVSGRDVNMAVARGNAAAANVDPGLAAALARMTVPGSMVDQSVASGLAAVDPALRRALEARNATGVGMPPATRSVPSVAIPGPNAMPKNQDRLAANQFPAAPGGQVASALSTVPFGPRPRPLRQNVNVAFPTPVSQRPSGLMAATPQAAPLRVTVQGANSYVAPPQRFAVNGMPAVPRQTVRYNTDTNTFVPVTLYDTQQQRRNSVSGPAQSLL